MDFSSKTFFDLLLAYNQQGFSSLTFERHGLHLSGWNIILRHDIDLRPDMAVQSARIESKLGISGTFYFRSVNESWDEVAITKIANMGHEVGYHYEDLALVDKRLKTPYTPLR